MGPGLNLFSTSENKQTHFCHLSVIQSDNVMAIGPTSGSVCNMLDANLGLSLALAIHGNRLSLCRGKQAEVTSRTCGFTESCCVLLPLLQGTGKIDNRT